MANALENKRVAILVTTGFEEVEMTEPREALREEGASTHLISPAGDYVEAWDSDDWGEEYEVDRELSEVDPADYDALLLPGGQMNPDFLRINEEAVQFVKHFFDAGKPVAAICHAPWLLIEAGVIKGRKATSYMSIRTDMKNAGADWIDQEVVRDGNLVTSRNPDDIPAFNEAMIELFREVEPAAAQA